MNSISYQPKYNIVEKIKKEYGDRIVNDALVMGLGDLPDPFEFNNIVEKLVHNENIFSEVSVLRDIDTIRTVYIEKQKILLIILKYNRNRDTTLEKSRLYVGGCFNELMHQLDPTHMGGQLDINDLKMLDQMLSWNDEIREQLSLVLPINSKCVAIKRNNIVHLVNKGENWEENESVRPIVSVNMDIFDSIDPDVDYILFTKDWRIANTRTLNAYSLDVDELLKADNIRCGLPPLEKRYAQSNTLGLWDAYWPQDSLPDLKWYYKIDINENVESANPWESVQEESYVAIDFGTSSTVAAVKEDNGNIRLLRIGGDLASSSKAEDYENPTAIEFSNYKNLQYSLTHEPWRPHIQWKDVKCSHQAKHELAESQYAQRGLRTIKTWARNRKGQPPLRLKDEQDENFELEPLLIEEEDVDGIGDFFNRKIDPIELYAYFIGLYLNNQAIGSGRIYTNYYMSYPVKFDKDTKKRIQQGFKRGLLRSMPPSLVYSKRWREEPVFELEMLAPEPVALAACVLPYLKIDPTDGGTPFGVFDFGGGTTDFAFGLYRYSTAEEKANYNWKRVLDILDVSGDEDLGGEHLIDLIAYRVVELNKDVCLESNIVFSSPAGLDLFEGYERILSPSYEGQANTVVLREALRTLWENGDIQDENCEIRLNLLDRNGTMQENKSLSIDKEILISEIGKRIEKGIYRFFTTFKQAFKSNNLSPEILHIILAGNSCRSKLVTKIFDEVIAKESEIYGLESTAFKLHSELIQSISMEDKEKNNIGIASGKVPTLKTGVAIGLLNLGMSIGFVERNRQKGDDEGPFLYTCGIFEDGVLKPILIRNASYGKWELLTKVFNHKKPKTIIGYTNDPGAIELQVTEDNCLRKSIKWDISQIGRMVYVKPASPAKIEVALGDDENNIDETTINIIELK